MRKLLPFGLALSLAGLVYYNATLPEIPLRLRLNTDATLPELHNCIYRSGHKEFANLDRSSDNITSVGSSRFGSRRGATYLASDGKVRITLEEEWTSNEVTVRSTRPLTATQVALIERCAQL